MLDTLFDNPNALAAELRTRYKGRPFPFGVQQFRPFVAKNGVASGVSVRAIENFAKSFGAEPVPTFCQWNRFINEVRQGDLLTTAFPVIPRPGSFVNVVPYALLTFLCLFYKERHRENVTRQIGEVSQLIETMRLGNIEPFSPEGIDILRVQLGILQAATHGFAATEGFIDYDVLTSWNIGIHKTTGESIVDATIQAARQDYIVVIDRASLAHVAEKLGDDIHDYRWSYLLSKPVRVRAGFPIASNNGVLFNSITQELHTGQSIWRSLGAIAAPDRMKYAVDVLESSSVPRVPTSLPTMKVDESYKEEEEAIPGFAPAYSPTKAWKFTSIVVNGNTQKRVQGQPDFDVRELLGTPHQRLIPQHIEVTSKEELFPSTALTRRILGPRSAATETSENRAKLSSETAIDEIADRFRSELKFLMVRMAKQSRLKGERIVTISDGSTFEPSIWREVVFALPIDKDYDNIMASLHQEFLKVIKDYGFRGPWGEYALTDKGIILMLRELETKEEA